MTYLLYRFLLPPEAEDLLTAELWRFGTLGTHSFPSADDRIWVEAYFAPCRPPSDGALRGPGLSSLGVELVAREELPAFDWLQGFRRRARPFALGRRLLVDPREPGEKVDVPPGRQLLRLPARCAFGTGSHESTRLAVELLEERPLAGCTVLDVGTGTGVLAFAALLFGAASVVALDSDPAAVFTAYHNCALNRLRPRLVAAAPAALQELPRFHRVVINVLPQLILPEVPSLVSLLRLDGELIVSGFLWQDRVPVLESFGEWGLYRRRARRAGDWGGLRLGLRE